VTGVQTCALPIFRRRLAEVLAGEDAAPRHLLLALLEDHPVVAEPIAARSEALIDPELVDVVAHGVDEIRRAVARRRRVGPTVAVALAEAGDRDACIALLANAGAEMPPIALERIVERFGEFSDIRKVLLARPHVPITVRHRVLEKLAEAIENLVVVKSWMGPERAESATRESREKATIALAGNATAAETVVLVEHLRRTGQLTTRLMLRAACVGDLRFVEEAIALLADVPTPRVAALVADGRESAIRALYRRAAMPDRAWPAFLAAIEVHRDLLAETGGLDGRPGDRARFSRRLVERVLTRFTAFERRDVDDLLVLLRRFAADAAREHVRHVMEERMADVSRALAAPAPVAEVATEVAATAPEIEASILDAVAAELGVGIAEAEAADGAPVEAVAAEPYLAFAAEVPLALEEGAVSSGLFAHVRLEDLPPEWLVETDVSPEALWGDEEISVRRAIVPELRLVVDEPDLPIFASLDASAEVPEIVAAEIVAADAVFAESGPAFAPDAAVETAPAEDTASFDEIACAAAVSALADEPEATTSTVAEVLASAVETPPAAEAVESAEDPEAATAEDSEADDTDPFIDRLQAALDAILGPVEKPRRAA
jgi:uncharacterized protein (DUF2336 family)